MDRGPRMDERRYLSELIDRRQRMADEGLWKPSMAWSPEFAYGHTVGMNHGLRLAEELLAEMLRDEADKEKSL